MERREQVTRIRISRVNGQPEEPEGSDGRRQPSLGGTSRVSREAQARICEGLGCNSRAYSAGFFGAAIGNGRTQPGGLIAVLWIGVFVLGGCLVVLGIGLLRGRG